MKTVSITVELLPSQMPLHSHFENAIASKLPNTEVTFVNGNHPFPSIKSVRVPDHMMPTNVKTGMPEPNIAIGGVRILAQGAVSDVFRSMN